MRYNSLFTEEQKEFILANHIGKTNKELTELVNSKFDLDLSVEQIKSWKNTHKIRSRKRKDRAVFPEEVVEYVLQIAANRWSKETAQMVNEKFGTNYSSEQIRGICKRNGLSTNKNPRFKKGHTAWNKGLHIKCNDGSTCFKKGHIPLNTVPIGTKRKTKDGYWVVKVEEPKRWVFVHRRTWEQHYGEIPKDCCVTFKDGNKDNCDIENLQLITKLESLKMNHKKLRFEDADLTEVGVLLAKMEIKKKDLLKKG